MSRRLAGLLAALGRKVSLQARVAILLALAVLPVGAIGVWQAVVVAREASSLEQTALANRTRRAAEEEQVVVSTAQGALDGLASVVVLDTFSEAACSEAMRNFVDTDPKYSLATFAWKDGTVICSSAPDPASGSFRGLIDGWLSIVGSEHEVSISDGSREFPGPLLNISRDVYRSGETAGTLVVSIPASLLKTITRASDDPDFRLALFDWQGIKAAEDTPLDQDPHWWPDSPVLADLDAQEESVVRARSMAGAQRAYAIVPIIPGELVAIGSWRTDQLAASAWRRTLLAVLFPATMWILALGVAYFAVHRLAVRHIEYLRRLIRVYESGRLSVRARQLQSASPEIAELGEAFDRMAETIERDKEELEHAVDEKNMLLKEVHHRVKNNLQLVVSMMNMQLREAENDHAREAIANVQNRVMSLATVHQRLYQAGDLTAVRCDDLISEIVKNLVASDPRARKLTVNCELLPLRLEPDRAIPLSLIATESIINALKYGADVPASHITVKMVELDAGQICMTVENPAINPDIQETGGVGVQLKTAFARQLGGKIERTADRGVYRLTLVFPAASGGDD